MATRNSARRSLLATRSRGEVGLLEIAESVEHYIKHGDWSRLGRLMEAVGRKDSSIIREICERCLLGARFEPSSRAPTGWRLRKSRGAVVEATPALDVCKKLAADGFSFRSRVLAEHLSLTHFDEVDYDLDRAMKTIIKRAEKAGKSQEVLDELETCRRRLFRIDS